MPYTLKLPDGTLVADIPDDVPPNTAYARIAEQIPGLEKKLRKSSGKDLGKDLAAGAYDVGKIVTGDIPELMGLGKNRVGEWFAKQGKDTRDSKSAYSQLDDMRIQAALAEAEKAGLGSEVMEAIKQYGTNPRAIGSFLATNAPQIILSLLTGGGASLASKGLQLGAKAAGRVAVGTAVGTGAVMQGADVGSDVLEEARGLWKQNPGLFRALPEFRQLVAGGKPEAEAAEAVALSKARMAGAVAGGLSALLGATPIGGALERAVLGKSLGKGVLKGAGVTALKEAPTEFIEEFGGKVGGNLALQGVDPERGAYEGAGVAGIQGLIGGAGMGAVAGAYGGYRGDRDKAREALELKRVEVERAKNLAKIRQEQGVYGPTQDVEDLEVPKIKLRPLEGGAIYGPLNAEEDVSPPYPNRVDPLAGKIYGPAVDMPEAEVPTLAPLGKDNRVYGPMQRAYPSDEAPPPPRVDPLANKVYGPTVDVEDMPVSATPLGAKAKKRPVKYPGIYGPMEPFEISPVQGPPAPNIVPATPAEQVATPAAVPEPTPQTVPETPAGVAQPPSTVVTPRDLKAAGLSGNTNTQRTLKDLLLGKDPNVPEDQESIKNALYAAYVATESSRTGVPKYLTNLMEKFGYDPNNDPDRQRMQENIEAPAPVDAALPTDVPRETPVEPAPVAVAEEPQAPAAVPSAVPDAPVVAPPAPFKKGRARKKVDPAIQAARDFYDENKPDDAPLYVDLHPKAKATFDAFADPAFSRGLSQRDVDEIANEHNEFTGQDPDAHAVNYAGPMGESDPVLLDAAQSGDVNEVLDTIASNSGDVRNRTIAAKLKAIGMKARVALGDVIGPGKFMWNDKKKVFQLTHYTKNKTVGLPSNPFTTITDRDEMKMRGGLGDQYYDAGFYTSFGVVSNKGRFKAGLSGDDYGVAATRARKYRNTAGNPTPFSTKDLLDSLPDTTTEFDAQTLVSYLDPILDDNLVLGPTKQLRNVLSSLRGGLRNEALSIRDETGERTSDEYVALLDQMKLMDNAARDAYKLYEYVVQLKMDAETVIDIPALGQGTLRRSVRDALAKKIELDDSLKLAVSTLDPAVHEIGLYKINEAMQSVDSMMQGIADTATKKTKMDMAKERLRPKIRGAYSKEFDEESYNKLLLEFKADPSSLLVWDNPIERAPQFRDDIVYKTNQSYKVMQAFEDLGVIKKYDNYGHFSFTLDANRILGKQDNIDSALTNSAQSAGVLYHILAVKLSNDSVRHMDPSIETLRNWYEPKGSEDAKALASKALWEKGVLGGTHFDSHLGNRAVVIYNPGADATVRKRTIKRMEEEAYSTKNVGVYNAYGNKYDSDKVGSYNPDTDQITLDPEHVTEHLVLHEATHAGTERVIQIAKGKAQGTITPDQAAAVNELDQMYTYVKGMLGPKADDYGLTDLSEFVAEAWSNEAFVTKLKGIPSPGPSFRSLWERFLYLVQRILGMDIKPKGNTVLKQVDEAIERVLGTPDFVADTPGQQVYAQAADPVPEENQPPITMEELIQRETPTPQGGVKQVASNFLNSILGHKVKLKKKDGTEVEVKMPSPLEVGAADRRARLRVKFDALGNPIIGDSGKISAITLADYADATIPQLAQGVLEHGPLTFNEAGEAIVPVRNPGPNYIQVVDSLSAAAKAANIPITRAVGMLNAALKGKRAAAVMSNDKEANARVRNLGVPLEEQALGDQIWMENPWIAETYGIMRAHLNGQIDAMVAAGKIPSAKAQEWKDATYYVPFIRVFNDSMFDETNMSTGALNSPMEVVKKLVGGKEPLQDVLSGMMDQSMYMTAAAVKSNATRAIAKKAVDLGLAAPVKSPSISPTGTRNYDAKFFDDNGKEVGVRFTDREDALALGGMTEEFGPLLKMFQKTSALLRAGIVRMPDFAVRDIARNASQAWFFSGSNAGLLKTTFRVANNAAKNVVQHNKRALGRDVAYTDTQLDLMERGLAGHGLDLIGDIHELDTVRSRFGYTVGLSTKLFRKMMDAVYIDTDMASKTTLVDQLVSQGVGKEEAIYRAYGMAPFAQRGRWPLVRTMSAMAPFIQANIKGLHVLSLMLRGNAQTIPVEQRKAVKHQFIMRGVMLAVSTALYTMFMDDDELYNAQSPSSRDMNFIFPVGDAGWGTRLPVAPEAALLFKIGVERMTRAFLGHEDAWRGVGSSLADNYVPMWGIMPGEGGPQLIKPWIELAAGKSFHTNAPIVRQDLAKLDPNMQYTPDTTTIAKWVGNVMSNVPGAPEWTQSPVKLEYMVKGILGNAALFGMQQASSMVDAAWGDNTVPDRPWARSAGLSSMFATDTAGNAQAMFYEMKQEADRVAATFKALTAQDKERASEYYDEHRATLDAKKILDKLNTEMAAIRKAQKKMLADPEIDPDTKSQQRDEMTRAINVKAAEAKSLWGTLE